MVTAGLALGSCTNSVSDTNPPPSSVTNSTSEPADSSTRTTESDSPIVTSTELSQPVEGWGSLDVDATVFGSVSLVDGAHEDGRWILAGCEDLDSGVAGFPMWWSDDASSWNQALSTHDAGCITKLESTPFGYFAAATGIHSLFWSADGSEWRPLELHEDFGLEFPGQLGVVFAIFVAPNHERVTLLFSRAAEAESRIATLVTTTDGETWKRGPPESARLFDSSSVSAVIDGGPGLLAVGASPGGEFVPSAAVFTSPDGLDWTRVTPRSPDFDDKVMTDVLAVPQGYIAVGGDFFETSLMTTWTSLDGELWAISPPPDETAPEFGFMTANAVTSGGGSFWASGREFDAARTGNQEFPAMWRSDDGVIWERVDIAQLPAVIPFVLVETPELRLGVWPPPHSPIPGPPQLYGSD